MRSITRDSPSDESLEFGEGVVEEDVFCIELVDRVGDFGKGGFVIFGLGCKVCMVLCIAVVT